MKVRFPGIDRLEAVFPQPVFNTDADGQSARLRPNTATSVRVHRLKKKGRIAEIVEAERIPLAGRGHL